jgi:hypothetical protein
VHAICSFAQALAYVPSFSHPNIACHSFQHVPDFILHPITTEAIRKMFSEQTPA